MAKGSNKNVLNYHFDFPCAVGKIMSFSQKKAVLEQKAAKLVIKTTLAAEIAIFLIDLCFVS